MTYCSSCKFVDISATPVSTPQTTASEKSIEQQFIAALDNMTCFERARTDYIESSEDAEKLAEKLSNF